MIFKIGRLYFHIFSESGYISYGWKTTTGRLKGIETRLINELERGERDKVRQREWVDSEKICEKCSTEPRIVIGACFRSGSDMLGPWSLCENCLAEAVCDSGEPYRKLEVVDSAKYKMALLNGQARKALAQGKEKHS